MENKVKYRLDQYINYAYQSSPAIKNIFDEAGLKPGDIQSIADLEKVPVTSKDKMVELQNSNPPFGGFLAIHIDNLQHVFLSPGPLYEPSSGDSAAIDSIGEVLSIAGFGTGDIVLNAFGYHLIPTGLLVDQELRKIGATVIPAGVGNAELQIKILRDLKVTGYVGTPSWLMTLLEKIPKTNQDLSAALFLQKVLVSAEPLPPSMREVFTREFGLQVINAYGTAELGFLAVNIDGSMPMQLLGSSIIEVVDPDTGLKVNPGDVGEVVATVFNKTYPLIRLGTGDLAMNVDPRPGESQQEERAIILVGRSGEAVKVRGMLVHPNQLRYSVGQVPGIERFQAIVSRPNNRDSLMLKVVLSASDQDPEPIQEMVIQMVKSYCRVNVDQIIFVNREQIGPDEPIILDQRSWD